MHGKKFLYEYDPTGILAANRIPDEPHTITPVNGSRYYVLMPRFAPFFRQNLRVYHAGSSRPLDEGVHYDLGFHYKAASLETQQPVYGCIVITDTTLAGVFKVTYQTLGGEFVLDDVEIDTILANIKNDPRTVKFDDIIGRPITFPPSDHLHHSDDLVGMEDVEKAILACADSASENLSKALLSLLEHLKDHNNPHHVTLQQLGLDELGSLAEATDGEIEAGTDASHYVSARGLEYFRKTKVAALLKTHTDRTDNPHGVTKEQVGLGAVENYRPATLQEAMEGKLNNRYLTPYLANEMIADKIAEALVKWAGENGVTKESIGLGNVPNYGMATEEEALAGVLNERLMSPLLVSKVIANAIATAMRSHLDEPNPHNITKRTIGLENVENVGVATQGEIESGVATNKLTTVAQVKAMIDLFGGGGGDSETLTLHLNDHNNPHNVTKEQVGLEYVPNWRAGEVKDVVLNSLVDDAFMSPKLTASMITLYLENRTSVDQQARESISEHIDDKNNPHETDKTQVGLGDVENYGVANREDVANKVTNKYLTPAIMTDYVDEKIRDLEGGAGNVITDLYAVDPLHSLDDTIAELSTNRWFTRATQLSMFIQGGGVSRTERADNWGLSSRGVVYTGPETKNLHVMLEPSLFSSGSVAVKASELYGSFVIPVSLSSGNDLVYLSVTTDKDNRVEITLTSLTTGFNNVCSCGLTVGTPHNASNEEDLVIFGWKADATNITFGVYTKRDVTNTSEFNMTRTSNDKSYEYTWTSMAFSAYTNLSEEIRKQLGQIVRYPVTGIGVFALAQTDDQTGISETYFRIRPGYQEVHYRDITLPSTNLRTRQIGLFGNYNSMDGDSDDFVFSEGTVIFNPVLDVKWTYDTELEAMHTTERSRVTADYQQPHRTYTAWNLGGDFRRTGPNTFATTVTTALSNLNLPGGNLNYNAGVKIDLAIFANGNLNKVPTIAPNDNITESMILGTALKTFSLDQTPIVSTGVPAISLRALAVGDVTLDAASEVELSFVLGAVRDPLTGYVMAYVTAGVRGFSGSKQINLRMHVAPITTVYEIKRLAYTEPMVVTTLGNIEAQSEITNELVLTYFRGETNTIYGFHDATTLLTPESIMQMARDVSLDSRSTQLLVAALSSGVIGSHISHKVGNPRNFSHVHAPFIGGLGSIETGNRVANYYDIQSSTRHYVTMVPGASAGIVGDDRMPVGEAVLRRPNTTYVCQGQTSADGKPVGVIHRDVNGFITYE